MKKTCQIEVRRTWGESTPCGNPATRGDLCGIHDNAKQRQGGRGLMRDVEKYKELLPHYRPTVFDKWWQKAADDDFGTHPKDWHLMSVCSIAWDAAHVAKP